MAKPGPTNKPERADAKAATLRLRTQEYLAAGGDAVARAPDGRVVFVRGAAPDEEVEARIDRDNASFLRASVATVCVPSVERVSPPCPHFGNCGGCSLQHVSAARQTESKQASFFETLHRIAGIPKQEIRLEPAWAGSSYGYRTRARFSLSRKGAGYRALNSHAIVPVDSCPILSPALNDALKLASTVATKADLPEELEVSVVEVRGQVQFSVMNVSRDARRKAHHRVASALRAAGASLAGEESLVGIDCVGRYFASAACFSQANAAGNDAMLQHVAKLIDTIEAQRQHPLDRVVELYAGSGNFTRILARRARQVRASEVSRLAVSLAKACFAESPSSGGARVEIEVLPAEEALAEEEGLSTSVGPPDLLFVNPPREGLPPKTGARIGRLGAEWLIYVSCDPATLSRDLRGLIASGYRLVSVRMFDLYPQTAHLEAIACLVRAPSPPALGEKSLPDPNEAR